MPLTPLTAAEYNTEGGRGNSVDQPGGQLQMAHGTWTSTVAGVGEASVIKLPAGKIRVHSALSSLLTGNLSLAGADLHIGYAAYTGSDQVAVVADENAFLDNADLGGAALSGAWLLPAVTTAIYTEFNSESGIDITITIDTANASIGETVQLVCAYTVVS